MDPGLLDVLHDPADDLALAVRDDVDVDLDRVLEEVVDEDRPVRGDVLGDGHVPAHRLVVVHDLHRAAAEHVGRPDEHGVADALRDREGLVGVRRHAARRLPEPELLHERVEPLAVLGAVDAVGARADDRDARLLEPVREVERRLPAELDDDARRLLLVDDVQHVLERQRLEEEAVARCRSRSRRSPGSS